MCESEPGMDNNSVNGNSQLPEESFRGTMLNVFWFRIEVACGGSISAKRG